MSPLFIGSPTDDELVTKARTLYEELEMELVENRGNWTSTIKRIAHDFKTLSGYVNKRAEELEEQ